MVILGGKNSRCTTPWSSKNTSMSVFLAWRLQSTFFGRLSSLWSHWQLLCFCSGSSTLNHNSAPVTTVHKKSRSWVAARFSLQTATLKSFWSWVRMRGTNFGAFFFKSRSCFRMLCTLPVDIWTSAATCLTIARQSFSTTSCTALTFDRVLAVILRPGLSLSLALRSPSEARMYHLLQVDLDKLSSPYTSCSNLNVSPWLFPFLTQAMMWCRCAQQIFILFASIHRNGNRRIGHTCSQKWLNLASAKSELEQCLHLKITRP